MKPPQWMAATETASHWCVALLHSATRGPSVGAAQSRSTVHRVGVGAASLISAREIGGKMTGPPVVMGGGVRGVGVGVAVVARGEGIGAAAGAGAGAGETTVAAGASVGIVLAAPGYVVGSSRATQARRRSVAIPAEVTIWEGCMATAKTSIFHTTRRG
jgi:hypothetical protein